MVIRTERMTDGVIRSLVAAIDVLLQEVALGPDPLQEPSDADAAAVRIPVAIVKDLFHHIPCFSRDRVVEGQENHLWRLFRCLPVWRAGGRASAVRGQTLRRVAAILVWRRLGAIHLAA